MLGAHGVRADALQLLDQRFLVTRRQRVAVTAGVFLEGGAVHHQALAVEEQASPRPGQLAQADARRVAALVADRERQLVEVGAGRRPQRWIGDRDVRAELDRLPVGERPFGGDRARSARVVADFHADPHGGLPGDRSGIGQHVGRERGLDGWVEQLAFADRPYADIAVDPAPVEPRAVKAFARLRRRVAPVDADDDGVRAGRYPRARFERQVGAAVRAE